MSMNGEARVAIERLAIRDVNLIAESAAVNGQTVEEALIGYLELLRMGIHHTEQRIAKECGRGDQ